MASKMKFELEAELREDIGKGASRRLRRSDKIPGVMYGGGKEPAALTLPKKSLAKALEQEAFYSQILSIKTGKHTDRVILKAVQRHPYKPSILHVDFQRVRADEKLQMHIPLHFIGAEAAPGAKTDGGMISHIMNDVEIACLPDNLPEHIEVDLSNMALNDIIHLSDLKLPKGVELVALMHGDDKAVVSLHMQRIEEEPVEEAIAPSEVPAISQKGDEDQGQDESK